MEVDCQPVAGTTVTQHMLLTFAVLTHLPSLPACSFWMAPTRPSWLLSSWRLPTGASARGGHSPKTIATVTSIRTRSRTGSTHSSQRTLSIRMTAMATGVELLCPRHLSCNNHHILALWARSAPRSAKVLLPTSPAVLAAAVWRRHLRSRSPLNRASHTCLQTTRSSSSSSMPSQLSLIHTHLSTSRPTLGCRLVWCTLMSPMRLQLWSRTRCKCRCGPGMTKLRNSGQLQYC